MKIELFVDVFINRRHWAILSNVGIVLLFTAAITMRNETIPVPVSIGNVKTLIVLF